MSHPSYTTMATIADRIGARIGAANRRDGLPLAHTRTTARLVARDALEGAGATLAAAEDFSKRAQEAAVQAHTPHPTVTA